MARILLVSDLARFSGFRLCFFDLERGASGLAFSSDAKDFAFFEEAGEAPSFFPMRRGRVPTLGPATALLSRSWSSDKGRRPRGDSGFCADGDTFGALRWS